jgi:hypothetical protein
MNEPLGPGPYAAYLDAREPGGRCRRTVASFCHRYQVPLSSPHMGYRPPDFVEIICQSALAK